MLSLINRLSLTGNHRGLGAAPPAPALDGMAASAAYSTSRLFSSYTGPCLRVRRSSDNAEQNIGFSWSGLMNVSAATAFAAGSDLYVVTWYDQSGNGRNLTQATTTAQPRLYLSGSPLNGVNTPALYFDNADDGFGLTATAGALPSSADVYVGLSQSPSVAAVSVLGPYATQGSQFLLAASAGSAIVSHLGAGTPTQFVNGTALPTTNTQATVSAAFPVGQHLVGSVRGANLSGWASLNFGGYQAGYAFGGWATDIIVMPAQTASNRTLITSWLINRQLVTGLLAGIPSAGMYALHRLRSSASTAVTLRRSSDNAQAAWGFGADGELEEQAIRDWYGGQNYLLNSADLTQSLLTSVTAAAGGTGPTVDGISSPWTTLTATAGLARHDAQQTATMTIGYAVCGSAVIKGGTARYAALNIMTAGAANRYVGIVLDTQTGTITQVVTGSGATAPHDYGVIDLGGGAYRVYVSATMTEATVYHKVQIADGPTPSRAAYGNVEFNATGTETIQATAVQLLYSHGPGIYTSTTTTAKTNTAYVVTWHDQSGQGKNATQGTAASQPQLRLKSYKCRPAVWFSHAAANWLTTSATPNIISNGNGSAIIGYNSATISGDRTTLYAVSGTSRFKHYSNSTGTRMWYSNDTADWQGAIPSLTHNIAAIDGITGRALGAVDKVITGATYPGADYGAVTIGAGGSGSLPYWGNMTEVILRGSLFSKAEMNAIGGTLAARYGMTWSQIP